MYLDSKVHPNCDVKIRNGPGEILEKPILFFVFERIFTLRVINEDSPFRKLDGREILP